MSTDAQIAANRRNAQLSSGPTSETGKATSSLNALKTRLTGRTVLLPSEDAGAYFAPLARCEAQWRRAPGRASARDRRASEGIDAGFERGAPRILRHVRRPGGTDDDFFEFSLGQIEVRAMEIDKNLYAEEERAEAAARAVKKAA